MGTSTVDYIGNPTVYAVQQDSGIYYPQREAITPDVLAKHDRGELTIGTYVTWVDKARFMVWDVDASADTLIPTKEAALAKARDIERQAAGRGFTPGVLFSGSKGYHVWVLLDEWELAADVQRLAQDIARSVGFNGEVNPKQAVAKDLGNLVKVPGGVHRKTGQRSRWLGKEPVPVKHDLFVAAVAILPPPPAPFVKSYFGEGRYPCIDDIIEHPSSDGERNNNAYHFAAHMKRAGLWGEPLIAALEAAVDCSDIDDVEGLVARLKGPNCNIAESRKCPAGQCYKDELGRPSKAQLRAATDGAVIRVEVTDNDGHVVNVVHPDGVGKFVLNKREGSDGN